MSNPSDFHPSYAASPLGGGPGVLVLHAWWGLNDTIRVFCDRLAEAGFVVAAPDLFAGQVAATIPEAERLATTSDDAAIQREVVATLAWLQARPGARARGLRVVGFSFGAAWALSLARLQPELVERVVTFYGTYPGDYSSAKAAFQCHFAENDPFEGPAEVAAMEQSLAGHPLEVFHYPSAGHWFMEPDRPEYHPAAAALAWERMVGFLREG